MKKNMRKIVTAILAVVFTATLFSACGDEGGNPTIKIGATGPLTGTNATYGQSVNNGAMLAVKEINAAGGINGIQLSFQMMDDLADAKEAASAYDQLLDDGMKASLGSVTSGAGEAFGKRAATDKLFFLTPSASSDSVIATSSTGFRVCFGDPDQGILAAKELAEHYNTIGCIYDNSDDYSSGIYDAFAGEMSKLGKSVEVRTFDGDTKKDFSAQVEALRACDVIFLPIYYQEASLIARKCVEKGLGEIVLFGCDGLDGVADLIDESITNQISYITPFDVNAKEGKSAAFTAAYKAEYGLDPNQFAADGYDAVYAIFEGMKKADIKDANISIADLSSALVKVFTGDFTFEGVTGTMKWEASGACEKEPIIVVLD